MAQPCLIHTKYTSENARPLFLGGRNAALVFMTFISFPSVSSPSPFLLSLLSLPVILTATSAVLWAGWSVLSPPVPLTQPEQTHARSTMMPDFHLGCSKEAALPWWLRHTWRGHEKWREAQPVNVIPTAHAEMSGGKEHYWGWYRKLQKTNKRNQMFPTLALCKPHTSLRVQPDRSLQLALNRIYLDLLHFYQENGDCGISLLSTCSPGPLIAYASGPNTPGKSNITQNWRVHLAWMHLSLTQLNWNSLLQIASWLQRTLQKRSAK